MREYFAGMNSFFRCASLLLLTLPVQALAASNSVVNLSHYDLVRPDFAAMRAEGTRAIIHEASYPRQIRDEYYSSRQESAVHAGMLWGAYHFANSDDPIRQADYFLNTVQRAWREASPSGRPREVLLVLDFEKNNHYPGKTMTVAQALAFAEHVRARTGHYPGLYSNEHRIQTLLGSGNLTTAQKQVLRSCWLWVANYHYPPRSISPWSDWTLWQYTGDGVCDLPRASYPKRAGNIKNAERNIFRGSTGGLAAFWQTHGWRVGGGDE